VNTENIQVPGTASSNALPQGNLALEVPTKAEGIRCTETGGAFAVTSSVEKNLLMTNKIGGRILALIDGTRNVAAIWNALADEFPQVDTVKLRGDVTGFLLNAEKRGVVFLTPRPVPGLHVFNSTPADEKAPSGHLFVQEQDWAFHPDIYWYLTFRCNLACTHCSVLSSPNVDTSTDLNTADCLQIVDQLAEMNADFVILSGGEALIRPDVLTILRALAERKIHVGLETNGLKAGEKAFIDLALELQEKKLLTIAVSLDGGTAETHSVLRGPGSFERTVRAMRTMHKNGITFIIQCVLNRENFKTIPDLYDLALEIHPERLIWSPLNSSGRGHELVQRIGLSYSEVVEVLDLIQQNKHRFPGINLIKIPPAMVPPKSMLHVFKGLDVGCSTTCKFPLLGVLPNGNITVCAVSRNDPALYFGNTRQVRLKTAWEKARMDLLRQRYVSTEELQGICGDCIWKRNCHGACRAKAYEAGGNFFSPFPLCQEAADRGEFPDAYRISKGTYAINS
jgi:radical SAM protein with 4Fe4S-binding SPASM domain